MLGHHGVGDGTEGVDLGVVGGDQCIDTGSLETVNHGMRGRDHIQDVAQLGPLIQDLTVDKVLSMGI